LIILPKCNSCPAILTWKQPYKKGDRPVEKNGKPHNCPNLKGGKTSSYASGAYNYDPFNGDEEAKARYMKAIETWEVWCDECKSKYRLKDPCDHHIPDGYKWKERRAQTSHVSIAFIYLAFASSSPLNGS